MIEVKRKGTEKFDGLLRRFNRIIQGSGLFRTIKETKYRTKPASRRLKREEAKRKDKIKKVRLNKLY